MICFTIDFFFFEVLGEAFTAGIIERIFFLKMTVQHIGNPISARMQRQYIAFSCQNER